MVIKRFKHWHIASKIMFISCAGIFFLLGGVFVHLLPFIEGRILQERLASIRNIVDFSLGIVGQKEALARSGAISQEQARREAAEEIGKLRYGGKEYVWINDLGKPVPTMIMHPTVPALNGKLLDDRKFNKATSLGDATGKTTRVLDNGNLFAAMAEVAEQSGQGVVNYSWPKPKQGGGATEELYPKLSYVKKFAPWGWVLGSGLYVDDLRQEVAVIRWSLVAFSFLFAALMLVLSFFTGRGITRTVGNVTQRLAEMSHGGDLSGRLPVERRDETGNLVGAFNDFLDNMKGLVDGIGLSAEHVAAASGQLTSTADRIATGSQSVAHQTASVATAAEEMAATSMDIARNCIAAVENANRASETALSGSEIVNHAVQSIQRISARVQESADTVESLGKRSEQIGQIIGTIEDIADQTNLLALNAAIEAARAGEQGRGFAVVADEVRALAERTTKATREIGEMIKSIQQETRSAVGAMQAGVLEVAQGTDDAARSGRALEEILEQVAEVTNQINQIATAAEEQTATTNEISFNMQRITCVVQETSGCSNETATAANELSRMAGNLRQSVATLRL